MHNSQKVQDVCPLGKMYSLARDDEYVTEFQQRCRNASPIVFSLFQLPHLSSGEDPIVERLVTSPILTAYAVCHLSLFINLALISAPPWDVERICKQTYEDLP